MRNRGDHRPLGMRVRRQNVEKCVNRSTNDDARRYVMVGNVCRCDSESESRMWVSVFLLGSGKVLAVIYRTGKPRLPRQWYL